jgi:RNA polymerase primary sigma factor
MHSDYLNPMLRELRDQQVRFAPREKKIEQAGRAEKLLLELDPKRSYPYDYLCYRITDYRPETVPATKIGGRIAEHDLRLFVEDLSDAANLPASAVSERVLTVEELSSLFKVSTKTISRWRSQGLVSRRFLFDGRKRVGFLKSSVEQFVTRNEEKVKRGAKFSQLSAEEKDDIIERARRLARAGACPAEITKRLAKRMGRSVETIRYTLKQFDQEHPALAIFPSATGPLDDDAKRKIYQQYRRGIAVEALAKRFCRTKTSIYRIINEMRAKRIMDLPLDYMPNSQFEKASAEKAILGPMPQSDQPVKKTRLPSGLPPYLASLYEVPLLTREQEAHLFRKLNYLKYRASKLRDELDPAHAKSSLMDQIEKFYDAAVATKNQIVRANLRLVVSIAKRQHVAHPGGREVRLRSRQQVQHVRELGDHEELCSDDSGRAAASRPVPHQSNGNVRCDAGAAHRSVRAGVGPEPARVPDRSNSGTARRARAADHRQPVRLGSRPRAADFERSWRRIGRHEGADSPD